MTGKDGLRCILQHMRDSISESRELSDEVIGGLLSLPEMDVHAFCVYVSKCKEVYTHDLIETLLSMNKVVTAPRVGKRGAMHACRFDGWEDLRQGRFGILEPTTKPYRGKIDVCIVPGLGFTKKGERIGYGQGYYDRFIERYPEATIIGLAYNQQVIARLPQEDHDKLMDIIVTEDEILRPKLKL